MSPRRIRRDRSGPPDPVPGPERVESWPDGDWVVRRIPGAGSAKAYRCPGCDQEIPAGTPHIVAWPADAQPFGINVGVGERRHWHRPCWQRRLDRRPARRAGPTPARQAIRRPGRRV
ncbi:MAG TPA: ATP/GTP-binding protein [Streptosporangiaceae bacterium]|nr:ATP/GTP-binding protein [Streptosporangiaceae bacterium]